MRHSVGRFSPRSRRRVIAGNPALQAFDRLPIAEARDGAERDLSETGKLVNRLANLFERNLCRGRDFAVEQLTVFLEMLENGGRGHVVSFQVSGVHLFYKCCLRSGRLTRPGLDEQAIYGGAFLRHQVRSAVRSRIKRIGGRACLAGTFGYDARITSGGCIFDGNRQKQKKKKGLQ